MKIKCTKLAEIEGNPGDQVSTLVFRDVESDGVTVALKNKHTNVEFENVKVNGTGFNNQ
ncbi:hypothetical protein [Siphonobacter sp.]|uniref:hypothetical protein n=1 Tax=Siphonobacter sp. TaxID=1869184 RepID=UPI003B39FEC0